MHWWDRAKVGFLGSKKVKALMTELNTCKASVNLALNCANFLAANAQHQATNKLLERNEEEIRNEGVLVVREASEVLDQMSEDLGQLALQALDNDVEEVIDVSSLRDLKKDVQRGRDNVKEYKELLATVLIKYECRKIGVTAKNIKIHGSSNVVVGVQNMDGTEHEIVVDIDDLLVDGGSSVMIGVQKNVDFTNFWNKTGKNNEKS